MLMISRVTMRKRGLAQYLIDGKRADSNLLRNQKDNVIPLYGSLNLLKKVEDYCNQKKNWSSNYEHITISFSDDDIDILNNKSEEDYKSAMSDIVTTMIRHRTSGYDIDNEVIAYAEIHDPKVKEEANARTGEIQKRRKHIHIGISYLNPLSDTKLQTTFYNNSYISDTIDKYIAKKHGLTYVPEKAPSDDDIDKPSQMTINRNILKDATKDFVNKEELYNYLDENSIRYDFTNKKSDTKQSNIYVYNDKGGKIHLRGKDFPNIEIMHNPTLNDKTKVSYIKELRTKSLQELGDILETYYKTNRIPLIAKKRNKETTKLLKDIYKQSDNNIENDKVNSFTSLQAKIFYKHYKHLVTTNLKGYYVDTKESDKVKFTNKAKDIEVTDLGDKITANASTKNLEEKVKLMVDIAIAKNWNLSTLDITGSDAFKKEAHKQIADIIRLENMTKKTLSLQTVVTVKGIERPKTVVQYLVKENTEKKQVGKINLSDLKKNLDAKIVLNYVVKKYKLDVNQYEITADNKINNLGNRQKPKNVIDFFQKEINLTSKEAIEECHVLFKAQPMPVQVAEPKTRTPIKIKKEFGEKMPLYISVNKTNQKNALTGWEVVEVSSYAKLATLMKQHSYASSQFDIKRDANNANTFNNLLIFDIDNDPKDKQLTIIEAKVLLKSKGISAMILPSKSHQIEKFTDSGKSKGIKDRYRIVIPTKTAIKNGTDKQTYIEFMELTAKALGLVSSVDTSALKDKARFYYQSPLNAVPVVIKSDRVMDISNLENKAISNVQVVRAEKEAQRLKMEELRANMKRYRVVKNDTSSNYLNFVDAVEIMDIPINTLIMKFESGVESAESSYQYIKTNDTKYSIIDDKLSHDFKNDITYNSLTYLQMQFETNNLNIIARELKKAIGVDYLKVNGEAVKTAINQSLKDATNDKTFEENIKGYFGCEYCKLQGDSIKIADQQIMLHDVGYMKLDIINSLKNNREVVAKELAEAKAREVAMVKKVDELEMAKKATVEVEKKVTKVHEVEQNIGGMKI